MKYRCALFAFLLFSGLAGSQEQHFTDTATSAVESAPSAPGQQSIHLIIENVGKAKVPDTLIQRIFRETVHEVAWRLNPEHPPRILARVTLRLGAPGFTVETIEGKERRTILCMKDWDELAFARMVARAARNGVFTDQELDQHARAGLARARAVTSVNELRQR